MSKIRAIEISFPVPIELPEGFDRKLSELIDSVCDQYEREHLDRVMWTAGHGSKPIWNDPKEPIFDDSIFHIEVAEREDYNNKNPHRQEKG